MGRSASTTNRGELGAGLRFVRQRRGEVNETYTLPVGKRSTYVNRANELELTFTNGTQELHLVLRAYDDGIAFRYVLPGSGDVEISAERTTFPLTGTTVTYWGQAHPNDYGYETPLGPITAERISMPVLAQLVDRGYFVLVAQAASYGSYVIPHFARSGNTLAVRFPMDQKEPVRTTLPFASPWRFMLRLAEQRGEDRRIVDGGKPESADGARAARGVVGQAGPRELGLHRRRREEARHLDRLRRRHGVGVARHRRGVADAHAGPVGDHGLREGAQRRDRMGYRSRTATSSISTMVPEAWMADLVRLGIVEPRSTSSTSATAAAAAAGRSRGHPGTAPAP